MRHKWWGVLFVLVMAMLAACSDGSNDSAELKMLDVDFPLPEEGTINEIIELKAIVTYGDDKVTEADQMEFEYWEEGDRDNSTFIDGESNGDGTYTAEVTFDKASVYEIYAHTTAESLHTMPKKTITIEEDD